MSRELIVISKENIDLTNLKEEIPSINNNNETSSLENILRSNQIQIHPIFNTKQVNMNNLPRMNQENLYSLSKYYKVEAPDENLEDIAEQLRHNALVEDVYIKPTTELARLITESTINLETSNTPNFISRQGYLDSAPVGVDARYAWNLPGGKGDEIKIIDIEGGWRFSHEDLQENQDGVISGNSSSDLVWENHGTAVLGVISGDENQFGILGISPNAKIAAISIFDQGSSRAIFEAANTLNPGDIILVELHRAGPRFNEQSRADQRGYIAIEWWQDDFAAIQFATSKGIIVVEAAGNGAENLDDEIYLNRFNRGYRDSGAILVGAGAPPPGTHNRDHGTDRSRLEFSNYGNIIDAQGWGREVTTTGYNDLQGGNEDVWYTDQFSGTSSASPIIVGVIACLQGITKSRKHVVLTAIEIRNLLRSSGSPQQDMPMRPVTQRIGNRPNLKQLIDMITHI